MRESSSRRRKRRREPRTQGADTGRVQDQGNGHHLAVQCFGCGGLVTLLRTDQRGRRYQSCECGLRRVYEQGALGDEGTGYPSLIVSGRGGMGDRALYADYGRGDGKGLGRSGAEAKR